MNGYSIIAAVIICATFIISLLIIKSDFNPSTVPVDPLAQQLNVITHWKMGGEAIPIINKVIDQYYNHKVIDAK